MNQSTKFLGSCWSVEAFLDPGEAAALAVPATGFATIQLTVSAGDSATAHGSCWDESAVADPALDAFPLFGEDGIVTATSARRTAAVPFPGPLRTVFVSAAPGNTKAVRVIILQ